MNLSAPQSLAQIITLVDKEDRRLDAVRQRLLGNDCAVAPARLNELLADDIGIDRLELFSVKFGRMQETVVDKLIPAVLRQACEPLAAAIDNLGCMHRLVWSARRCILPGIRRNSETPRYAERRSRPCPAV